MGRVTPINAGLSDAERTMVGEISAGLIHFACDLAEDSPFDEDRTMELVLRAGIVHVVSGFMAQAETGNESYQALTDRVCGLIRATAAHIAAAPEGVLPPGRRMQ